MYLDIDMLFERLNTLCIDYKRCNSRGVSQGVLETCVSTRLHEEVHRSRSKLRRKRCARSPKTLLFTERFCESLSSREYFSSTSNFVEPNKKLVFPKTAHQVGDTNQGPLSLLLRIHSRFAVHTKC